MKADAFGGFTCHVEQGHYGHMAPKATWLYACKTDLPALLWGKSSASYVVGYAKTNRRRPEMPKSKRHITPKDFRDLLIQLAMSVRRTS